MLQTKQITQPCYSHAGEEEILELSGAVHRSGIINDVVLRPGNIATAFALTHLLLNINEEGHTARILRLSAASAVSAFALEFTAVFRISGNHRCQFFNGISFAQRAEADKSFLIRSLQCRLEN